MLSPLLPRADVNALVPWLDFIGTLFVRLVLSAALPLAFAALFLGVYKALKTHNAGRLALRALGFTAAFSCLSSALGVALVNIFPPPPLYAGRLAAVGCGAGGGGLSPVSAGMALLLLTALCGGGFLIFLPDSMQAWVVRVMERGFTFFQDCARLALWAAPAGVFSLTFCAANVSAETASVMARYALTVTGGLALFCLLVYLPCVKFIARRGALAFLDAAAPALATAFATASSAAALPSGLEAAKAMKLDETSSRFILTAGASANQNGTALFEGVTVLFIAAAAGVKLSLMQQFFVAFACACAGLGSAGVAGASPSFITAMLCFLSVPPSGVGLVLGLDRLLDMARTCVNVLGDLVIAACAGIPARSDGK